MKCAFNLMLLLFISFLFFSCNEITTEEERAKLRKIDLPNGFYYLNGEDYKYKVLRKGHNELYIINPKAFITPDDYSGTSLIAEDNGKYSLDVMLNSTGLYKWQQAVEDSTIYYVGFILDKELYTILKAKKGETDQSNLILRCVAENKNRAEDIGIRMRVK